MGPSVINNVSSAFHDGNDGILRTGMDEVDNDHYFRTGKIIYKKKTILQQRLVASLQSYDDGTGVDTSVGVCVQPKTSIEPVERTIYEGCRLEDRHKFDRNEKLRSTNGMMKPFHLFQTGDRFYHECRDPSTDIPLGVIFDGGFTCFVCDHAYFVSSCDDNDDDDGDNGGADNAHDADGADDDEAHTHNTDNDSNCGGGSDSGGHIISERTKKLLSANVPHVVLTTMNCKVTSLGPLECDCEEEEFEFDIVDDANAEAESNANNELNANVNNDSDSKDADDIDPKDIGGSCLLMEHNRRKKRLIIHDDEDDDSDDSIGDKITTTYDDREIDWFASDTESDGSTKV